MNGKSCSGHKTGVIVAYAWKSTGGALVRGETCLYVKPAKPQFSQRRPSLSLLSSPASFASAPPDPPFEFMDGGTARGFDVELTQAIAAELGLRSRLVPYAGGDFNGIFSGLANGTWDCVASGATITPERERMAAFCAPCIESGQSLVCNIEATPHVRSVNRLRPGCRTCCFAGRDRCVVLSHCRPF
jgi:hypothetical protein